MSDNPITQTRDALSASNPHAARAALSALDVEAAAEEWRCLSEDCRNVDNHDHSGCSWCGSECERVLVVPFRAAS